MARAIAFLVLLCVYAASAKNPFKAIGSFIEDVYEEVKDDIADLKQPIEEGVMLVATGKCGNVKKLLGLSYEAMEDDHEPDLHKLTLVYRNSQVAVTFNLSSAAEFIPKTTGFNASQNVYIFVHGFTDNPTKKSCSHITEALFSKGDINVLALDASSLIKWLYLHSSTYVTFIGQILGEVLASMVDYGVDPSQIHIIGHSLGAHISGFAGKQFYNASGSRIGRISGLDPAGPCFADVKADLRLMSSDAEFVDVVHTNAGVLGLDYPIGHVDYWPNDGSLQANCFFMTCSHSRSWRYFAESVINPEAFPAVKCDSWAAFKKGNCSNEISYMGFPSNSSASGSYYLRTADDSPFGLGINGTIYDKSEEDLVEKIADLFG